ncbi:hypothetical protein Scep_006016 [Stephania cephalantha]|uniref:MLO-like protein n=1 Tax=Stephania cephalantha TaxID=152367 RepID=A0AAP0K940_9MAGN
MAEDLESLEYTPTWVVAVVCFFIVFISLFVERLIHYIGKFLKHKDQDALFEALQKLKEELMLLGFISLLLSVFQGMISHICIPKNLTNYMLPCKKETGESSPGQVEHYAFAFPPSVMSSGRRLLAAGGSPDHCAAKGKAPLLSLEALHQLHIFVFVLAVVHVAFCTITMVLAVAKIREWKRWEYSIRHPSTVPGDTGRRPVNPGHAHHHIQFFRRRAEGYWRKSVVISWIRSFFKQLYGSVTKSDYVAMRLGFIATHCPSNPDYDFHRYMTRTLEYDFKKVVGISWYLWLFVVFFLLLNVQGWHTYFWLSFIPLVLLLLVGAKLEHIITKLAEEVAEMKTSDPRTVTVRPSDKHFWFGKPGLVLYLIHFLLFQNAFEIAFFFWIWSTYGFNSCIMEKLGYVIPRVIIGVIVEVLCSYSTLPLYAIVTQMGSMFKQGIFEEQVESVVKRWHEESKQRSKRWKLFGSSQKRYNAHALEMQTMAFEAFGHTRTVDRRPPVLEGITTITESSDSD